MSRTSDPDNDAPASVALRNGAGATKPRASKAASTGKVGHQSMRQVNRSVVLDLIRATDTISRPELARRSGLTKPTVAAIVEDLIGDDIVRELGFTDSAGAGGRPARLLEVNADSAAYLGVEVGVEETLVPVADGR